MVPPAAPTATRRVAESRSAASDAAWALLTELVRFGVRHVVVCPGSRSQALALAAAQLERAGFIRLHVRIDERVAGFTALGIGRETGVPAAVICTSGTAVANLAPAVLEAHHAGVPLLLLTADRPPELRGIGANQATNQVDFFGDFVRLSVDAPTPEGGEGAAMRALAVRAFTVAVGGAPGPVHLNLPFREPLAGALPPGPHALDGGYRAVPERAAPVSVSPGPRTVVVAGADTGPLAVSFAEGGGWPLIAEIVSGARFGQNVVPDYRGALRALGGQVERAIVFGHPTLSREVTALLSRADVEVIAVRSGGEALNLNGRSRAVEAVEAAGEGDAAWLATWSGFGRRSPLPKDEACTNRPSEAEISSRIDRDALVRAVWEATTPEDRLVFGSSRLVRVADQVIDGGRQRVHANRGLAGIDGTIATATGIAVALRQAQGPSGITRVLLGDLALLHDVGALLIPDGEEQPSLQIIVGNDGGGTIFDGLEVAQVAPEADMARVQYTPQSVDLASLASAYGWEYVRADSLDALGSALASGRRLLIEAPLDR
ncbi:MAG: 2-succinyl-5-enolpyruvyl-6-hydroxy-3-cyclohexene-1-carboxylic-acid synthase [Microbacterium sp.]